MEEHICKVMAGRIKVVELAVQHMRYPHKRMPIVGLRGCERPFYAPPGQPILHIDVVSDIEVIIKADKIVTEHLLVNRQSRSSK